MQQYSVFRFEGGNSFRFDGENAKGTVQAASSRDHHQAEYGRANFDSLYTQSRVRLPPIHQEREKRNHFYSNNNKNLKRQQNERMYKRSLSLLYNPIASLGTSYASGCTYHSRSCIKIAAGVSAVTVLPDLKSELEEERDRLSSLLGVQPKLPPLQIESIIRNAYKRKNNTSWLRTSETRSLENWLDC